MKNATICALTAGCFMLILILDSQTASKGAQEGLALCCQVVIPSLLPFLFLSTVFTNAMSQTSLPILRTMGRLCGVPNGMEGLFIPAFLGGYPAGAQCVAASWHSGCLSREDAEQMLFFCNNAGPAFIFGMTASVFSEKWVPWLLWGIQILSACFTAVLFRQGRVSTARCASAKQLPVSDSLHCALKSMAYICGWVIVFRILISFLQRWVLWFLPQTLQVIVIGLLELSNGCLSICALSDLNQRIVLSSVLLSFGGFCVAMQTKSVLQGLSMHKYMIGKATQTLICLLFTYSIVYKRPVLLFPIFLLLSYILWKKKIKVAFLM